MNDNKIGRRQNVIKIGPRIVSMHLYARHERICFLQTRLASIAQRVAAAPTLAGFADEDLMPQPRQFARHSAQKMRVAVVPA